MENVGPWLLLVAGLALLASGISVFVRGVGQAATLGLVLVFGTALSGTGVFGLKFLPEFASFMKSSDLMKAITQNPSTETYAEAIHEIGSGQVKGAQSDLIAGHIVDNPVGGLDSLLEAGARQAKDQGGSRVLVRSRNVLQARAKAASDLTEALARTGNLSDDQVKRYDPGTRVLIASRVALARSRPLPGPAINPETATRIMRTARLTRPVIAR